jgi:hypothetical protein
MDLEKTYAAAGHLSIKLGLIHGEAERRAINKCFSRENEI